MSMEWLDKETVEFLDTIDMRNYFTKNHWNNISEIMDDIEEDHYELLKDDPHFEGYVFNWMSIYDFAEYIRNRYPEWHHWEEEVVTYFISPTWPGRED